jgi:opacity protein-like surface antigen
MLLYDHQLKKLSTILMGHRFGEDAMKKLLLISVALALMAVPALAADMLVKAPPRTPVPAWSWTGFYLGGNFGGGWARSGWFEDAPQSAAGGLNPGFQDASNSA